MRSRGSKPDTFENSSIYVRLSMIHGLHVGLIFIMVYRRFFLMYTMILEAGVELQESFTLQTCNLLVSGLWINLSAPYSIPLHVCIVKHLNATTLTTSHRIIRWNDREVSFKHRKTNHISLLQGFIPVMLCAPKK
jgi:hypothetical protein